jgi:hypothetical protein
LIVLRRVLVGSIVALALLGGACILGPKQDDPSSDNGPGTGDSGVFVDGATNDANFPHDTSGGGVDSSNEDTRPTGDVGASDTISSDAPPPHDADVGADTAPSDIGGDVPGDVPGDAIDDAGEGGGSDDGSVE